MDRRRSAGLLVSIWAMGTPRGNPQAESFFRTLNVHEVYSNDYEKTDHAWRKLRRFIDDAYNQKRLHSS